MEDKNKNRSVTFRLTEEEYKLLQDRAKDLRLSFSNFIRWTLAPYLLQARVKDSSVKVEIDMPLKLDMKPKNKAQYKLFNKRGRPRKQVES